MGAPLATCDPCPECQGTLLLSLSLSQPFGLYVSKPEELSPGLPKARDWYWVGLVLGTVARFTPELLTAVPYLTSMSAAQLCTATYRRIGTRSARLKDTHLLPPPLLRPAQRWPPLAAVDGEQIPWEARSGCPVRRAPGERCWEEAVRAGRAWFRGSSCPFWRGRTHHFTSGPCLQASAVGRLREGPPPGIAGSLPSSTWRCAAGPPPEGTAVSVLFLQWEAWVQ